MRVLGISGSLRADSLNSRLLRSAAGQLPGGVELTILEGLREIPPFDADSEPRPALAVERLREQIAGADAILIATPEYNNSVPGQLKNALDWASRPVATNALRNKPVAVIGASTGMFGAVWAQAEARKVLAATGARVVDRELPVANAAEAFDEHGDLRDRDLREQLESILSELVATAAQRSEPIAA